jgi:hypothetical protein
MKNSVSRDPEKMTVLVVLIFCVTVMFLCALAALMTSPEFASIVFGSCPCP